MANIRAEIEQRLRIAEEDGDYVDAEAYSAWLALDAAPEVLATDYEVVSIGGGNHYSARIQLLGPTAKLLGGRRVRLVPTSGGYDNG